MGTAYNITEYIWLRAFATPPKSPSGGSVFGKIFKDVAVKLKYGIIKFHKADKG